MKYRHLPLLVMCLLLMNLTIHAQSNQDPTVTTQLAKARWLGKISKFGEKESSLPTSTVKRDVAKKNKPKVVRNFADNIPRTSFYEDAEPKNGDALAKVPVPTKSFLGPIEPILNFDGVDQEASLVLPPDTNGDIGLDHYFQTTNGAGGSLITIFDKQGNQVYGPTSSAVFWEGLNVTPAGDPVVLYDQYEQRWMFSEFSGTGNHMLIAYSETADPLGDWNAYIVNAPNFPDYPKFGVWPDHLVITTNEFTPLAIPIYVVDKMAMVNGATDVDFVRLTSMTKFEGEGFQVASAIDADGFAKPAADTKPMVIRLYEDEWEGGQDQLELWEIDVDWSNMSAATMTNISTLNTTPFQSNVCELDFFQCVSQPGGVFVSVIQQTIMHRSQYRNFGSYESIVCNHTTDVTGDNRAGVRWYELRRFPGGDWEIFQEGTLGDNTAHRFIASMAMDGAGNVGIGYAVTNPNKFLSLRFSGRKTTDALGELTVDENEFISGISVNPFNRWGDYSSMCVDPVNERTFWYTGEYMGGEGAWKTRIATFELERDSIDVGPFAVKSPVSSAFLTNAEPVVVEFKNFGFSQQGNFDIAYSVNGSVPVIENINVTIDPDSTYTHTFTPTVDMSVIGDYDFKIWSSLDEDQFIYNDSTRRTIVQLTRSDAGISGINGIENLICTRVLEVGYVLKNFGQDELTSVTIDVDFNGTLTTIPWTGSLQPRQSTVIPVVLELLDGVNTISVTISLPNGVQDENAYNDAFARSFESIFADEPLGLRIETDGYGSETSWVIRDTNGFRIISGSDYDDNAVSVDDLCLREGCYDFTIFDIYGDGMCCEFGDGSYELVDANGTILVSGGEFDFEETKSFCFPFQCTLSATAAVSNESGENENDGSIMISTMNAGGEITYSLDSNAPQNSPVFNNLSSGTYVIMILDENGCTETLVVELATCLIQLTVDVSPPSSAATNDGIITIDVVNASDSLEYSINAGASFQDSNVFGSIDIGNYVIIVRDPFGCTAFQTVEVSTVTSTDDLTIGHSVNLFPNPTEGVIQVEIKGLDNTHHLPFYVYDLLGKRIHKGSISAFNGTILGKISIVAFPAGTYLLKFDHPELSDLYKMVKVE